MPSDREQTAEDTAAILVHVQAIHERVVEMDRRTAEHERDSRSRWDRHDAAHVALADKLSERAIAGEARMSRLESALSVRTWLGAGGTVVAWVLATLGIKS